MVCANKCRTLVADTWDALHIAVVYDARVRFNV